MGLEDPTDPRSGARRQPRNGAERAYRHVAGFDAHSQPDAPRWSSAATAFYALRDMLTAVLLVLELAGLGQIEIDVRRNSFAWEIPMEGFPTTPASVNVHTHPITLGDDVIEVSVARTLDTLLWLIGLNSFSGALAWWLPQDDRNHLPRWPNLAKLEHSMPQLRMVAMLASAYLTQYELATAAAPGDARRLLNAL